MSSSIEVAINILNWIIKNNKTIKDGCTHFKVHEGYLRKCKSRKSDPKYDEYTKLYNQCKLHLLQKIETTSELEDLLDKEEIIDQERIEFKREGDRIGVLDAKGNKHVKTLAQLIVEAKIDTSVWTVDKHVVNKWDVTNAEGNTYQNWQVKAWLNRNRTEDEDKQWKQFIKEISKYAPKVSTSKIKASSKDKKYLFELSLPDLHIGKLSWHSESGEDYDTKIAISRYNDAIEALVNQVEHLKGEIEEILLPIGNDLINIDNKNNMTTNGTPQSVDSRWQQMFLKTQKLLIYNIDRLSQIAPVKVLMVSGNHDNQTIFYLGCALEAWYRENDNVFVDNSPAQRKYCAYGVNLIGFTHGNEEKHNDLGLIMATEKPQLWANAKFRQIHLGHYHKKKEIKYVDSDEYQGFKVKVLPSLSGTDSWHASKGYMSVKSATGIMYHKERGMIAEYTFNVM